MADTHRSLCLVGAMDRLWFHHAVIFPEPISPQLISDCSMDKSSLPDLKDISSVLAQQEEEEEAETIKKIAQEEYGNRPTQNIRQTARKARSKSHSPKHDRLSKTSSKRVLEKTISSKTYEDLEQEEVKGFIDLGFLFKKEHISPRMMTVVPGLQRITKTNSEMEYLETMRPYLSEAWLIKRPDSPLLNMRVSKGYAAADMKKQLKSWARTVASQTIQESS